MKKFYLLLFGLCLIHPLKAQVEKTLEITAGNYTAALFNGETVTHLTLIGTINAWDIKGLGNTTSLTYLDISQTNITSTYMQYANFPDDWFPGMTTSRNSINDRGITLPNLKTIKLPNTLRVLGCGALYGCGLTSITFPASLERIGFEAFCSCDSLQSVYIPGTVHISEYAFASCTGLKVVEFEEVFDFISRGIFAGCTSLDSIILPHTLKLIQYNAFGSCPNIKSIYCKNPVPPSAEGGSFIMLDKSKCTLYIPHGSKKLYAAANEWKDFKQMIEMPGLDLIYEPYYYGPGLSVKSADVIYNGGWYAGSNKDWLIINPTRGDSSQTVTFTTSGSIISSDRFATVTFFDSYDNSQTIDIIQYAKANSTPVANAGPDQSVKSGDMVQLSGISSLDLNNEPITYLWKAPPEITLSSDSVVKPRFQAPSLNKDTTFLFILVVSDGKEKSVPDTMKITIVDPSRSVHLTAGSLADTYTSEELKWITKLTITGTMDARDFRFMRDSMPVLKDLYMKQATIVSYTGPDGTYFKSASDIIYPANTIPIFAFATSEWSVNKTLKSIKIPLNTEKIGVSAFRGCRALVDFPIPSSVISIDYNVFEDCTGLTSITIPSTVTLLESGVFNRCTGLKAINIQCPITAVKTRLFMDCSALTTVQLPSTVNFIENSAFENCSSLVLIDFPSAVTSIGNQAFRGCTSLRSLTFPSSLISIGEEAFYGCSSMEGPLSFPPALKLIKSGAFEFCSKLSGSLTFPETITFIGANAFLACSALTGELFIPPLIKIVQETAFIGCSGFTSLILPATVENIKRGAFDGCSGLSAIHALSTTPIPLDDQMNVFYGVDKTTTTLYVPFGSKERYSKANQWKDFIHIYDMPEITLSAKTILLDAGIDSDTVNISYNRRWIIDWDEPWVTVDPYFGEGNHTITISAEANTENAPRTAFIKVGGIETETQTIVVTQKGMTVGLDEWTTGANIKYYPNPFTTQLIIEVANPSLKAISVDIFTMTGQKIRTLIQAQKGDKINCTWDCRNEQGKQVPYGIYLLKVNKMAKQVIFSK